MRRKFLILTLCGAAISLASCAQTRIVDTACLSMPKGTMHKTDTHGTQRWMIGYEANRQEKCNG